MLFEKKTNLNFIVSIYFIFIAIINGSLQDYVRTFDPPPCTSRFVVQGLVPSVLLACACRCSGKPLSAGRTGDNGWLGRNHGYEVERDCSVKCNSEREVKWIWMKGGFRFAAKNDWQKNNNRVAI